MDKIIQRIGDVDPIQYGGGAVLQTDNGPLLEYLYVSLEDMGLDDEDTADVKLTVHQVYLRDDEEDFLDGFNWVTWPDVARWLGVDLGEYLRSASEVVGRALIAEDVGRYYGWENLDAYPMQITVSELKDRWNLQD